MNTENVGYVTLPIDPTTDYKKEINKLRKEMNAVILAHYYQPDDIQEIADYVGDSLALAQWAEKIEADVIVLCGVHFMGETAKIICPNKRVLVPDLNAGCSLADSCKAVDLEKFIKLHPGHKVVSYVNTTAAVKCHTDVVVTSTNARKIVESFPADQKLIFAPDRNLGHYLNSVTGREMVIWSGACHVHEQFSIEKIIELKKEYPDAEVLAHPECKAPLLALAHFIGSTAALLNHATTSDKKVFIVATESGILFEMTRQNPDKTFIPAPPNDSTCACNECNYMRLNTMEKLYRCMHFGMPEIFISEDIQRRAILPIQRMLELSK